MDLATSVAQVFREVSLPFEGATVDGVPGSGHTRSSRGDAEQVATPALTEETHTETAWPTTAKKLCKCGCGMQVEKHDWVWGHKSGLRTKTISMAEKTDLPTIRGEAGSPLHLAIDQIEEQIQQYQTEIEKLREVKQQIRDRINRRLGMRSFGGAE